MKKFAWKKVYLIEQHPVFVFYSRQQRAIIPDKCLSAIRCQLWQVRAKQVRKILQKKRLTWLIWISYSYNNNIDWFRIPSIVDLTWRYLGLTFQLSMIWTTVFNFNYKLKKSYFIVAVYRTTHYSVKQVRMTNGLFTQIEPCEHIARRLCQCHNQGRLAHPRCTLQQHWFVDAQSTKHSLQVGTARGRYGQVVRAG